MDHLYVIFLFKPPFSSGMFQPCLMIQEGKPIQDGHLSLSGTSSKSSPALKTRNSSTSSWSSAVPVGQNAGTSSINIHFYNIYNLVSETN